MAVIVKLCSKSKAYGHLVHNFAVIYLFLMQCKNISLSLSLFVCLFFFLAGYVAIVGFISFAVCYRYGPLVDEKSINILSWTLQLFGLLLVYLGIQIQQVAFALIVAALFTKNLGYPVYLLVAAWRYAF